MSGTNITAPAERRFYLYLCSEQALHKHVATNCGDQIRQKLSLQRQIIHCTLIATNFNAANWMQSPLAVQAAKNLQGQSVQLPASSMCADMRIERKKGGYKNKQWTSTSREKSDDWSSCYKVAPSKVCEAALERLLCKALTATLWRRQPHSLCTLERRVLQIFPSRDGSSQLLHTKSLQLSASCNLVHQLQHSAEPSKHAYGANTRQF
jgi:hypothetical protein